MHRSRVEEERIKSAFELAMERISSMPELTPEEIATQKQKQYGPVGEAAAGRYMSGAISGDELPGEIFRYTDEPLGIVRRAALSALCRAMRLEEPETGMKALKGMGLIAPGIRPLIERAAEDYARVLRDYDRERRDRSAELGPSILKILGIAGSAVKINLSVNEGWQEELERIRKAYEPGLETIRSVLMRGLENPAVSRT